MPKFNTYSAQFTATNAKAYAVAHKVFDEIENAGDKWQERLAAAGIIDRAAINEFVVVYVAATSESKSQPKWGQRGWTFNGVDAVDAARVKYLVSVATGRREVTLAKAKAKSNAIDAVAKLVESYNKLSAAEKRAFQRAIAK